MIEYEIVQMPLHGTASITGLTLNYQPDADYVGTDTVVYQMKLNGVVQKQRNICITIVEQ